MKITSIIWPPQALVVATCATSLAACSGMNGTMPSAPQNAATTQTAASQQASIVAPPGTAATQSSAKSMMSTQGTLTDVIAIDAGGGAAGSFSADKDFSPGAATETTNASIDTTGVSNPAPQTVYQAYRYGGAFTYTVPGLSPNAAYTVRLDLAETYWTAAGKRLFNVSVNGTRALSDFDIFKTAGAKDRAIAESFPATASGSGQISIAFTTVTDNALINGIEIQTSGGPAPTPTPGGFIPHLISGVQIYGPNDRENKDITTAAVASNSQSIIASAASFGNMTDTGSTYQLHIFSAGVPTTQPSPQVAWHSFPDSWPIGQFTSQGALATSGDKAAEIIEKGTGGAENATLWDGYNFTYIGTPGRYTPTNMWSAYSGCRIDPSQPMDTTHTCNSASDWSGIMIADGIYPEELYNSTVPGWTHGASHALNFEMPGNPGSGGGLNESKDRLRLRVCGLTDYAVGGNAQGHNCVALPSPTGNPEGYFMAETLAHYGAFATDNGGYFAFSHPYDPQPGDAGINFSNYDAFIRTINIKNYDILASNA